MTIEKDVPEKYKHEQSMHFQLQNDQLPKLKKFMILKSIDSIDSINNFKINLYIFMKDINVIDPQSNEVYRPLYFKNENIFLRY